MLKIISQIVRRATPTAHWQYPALFLVAPEMFTLHALPRPFLAAALPRKMEKTNAPGSSHRLDATTNQGADFVRALLIG
jgi:hypothetical protein